MDINDGMPQEAGLVQPPPFFPDVGRPIPLTQDTETNYILEAKKRLQAWKKDSAASVEIKLPFHWNMLPAELRESGNEVDGNWIEELMADEGTGDAKDDFSDFAVNYLENREKHLEGDEVSEEETQEDDLSKPTVLPKHS